MATSQTLYQQCSQTLYLHGKPDLPALYKEMAGYTRSHPVDIDHYGNGRFLNDFEAEIAELLGKEAAVFMPSGVMAQQIALRINADNTELPQFACHSTCHMEINEYQGYHFLHSLQANLLGERHRLIKPDDLHILEKPVSTLLVELPQRWCGGLLPNWDELTTLVNYHQHNIRYHHLDGARLWECSPYYGKSLTDICSLFDSAYVSFYKTLGGISGAMLAGDADFIEIARTWLRRQGGNLHQMHPFVIAAKMNFDKRLSKIPDYVERAAQIARLFADIDKVICFPEKPQTNMFHVHFEIEKDKLENNRDDIARQTGIWLGGNFSPSYLPQYIDNKRITAHFMEVHVGDVLLDMSDTQIKSLFSQLVN